MGTFSCMYLPYDVKETYLCVTKIKLCNCFLFGIWARKTKVLKTKCRLNIAYMQCSTPTWKHLMFTDCCFSAGGDVSRVTHQMTSGSSRSQPQQQHITMPSAFEPVYRPAPQYHPPHPQYAAPPPPALPPGMLPATERGGPGPRPAMGVQTPGVVGPSPGVHSPGHLLGDGRSAPYPSEVPPVPVYMPQHSGAAADSMHPHPAPRYAHPPPGSSMPAPPPIPRPLPPSHIGFDPHPAQVEYSYPMSPEYSPPPAPYPASPQHHMASYPSSPQHYPASYPSSPQHHPSFYPDSPQHSPAAYAGAYSYGNESYTPAGPAQIQAYRSGESRFYVPVAGSHPSRLYYPVNGRIAMPASVSPASPGPRLAAMMPVATGTPVHESDVSKIVNYDGSYLQPPSPISE